MNFMYLNANDENINFKDIIDRYEFNDKTSDKYLDVSNILDTYNQLKTKSRDNIKELDKLNKDNEMLIDYKSKLINTHTNQINILYKVNEIDNETNIDEISQLIDKYEKAITKLYECWKDKYYNPRLIKIENEMRESTEYLNIYQNFFKAIINDLDVNNENQNKKICSICFENEVDMCAVPCGHTCCNTCVISNTINPSNRNRCLNCRNRINNYIKIYFSI